MLILSNALSDRPDEGSLKAASCLAAALKAADPSVTVVSYERRASLEDIHLKLNKLLLNSSLIRLLRQRREPVLYLPFPTRALPMAARIFLLSRFFTGNVLAVLPMTRKHGPVSRWLLKHSKVRVAVLSRNARDFYRGILGEGRTVYLQTGVDTRRFVPVSRERRAALKKTYGLDPEKKVLLHVGHLKEGRNLRALLPVKEGWQMLLVVSTFTEKDEALGKELEATGAVTIFREYMPRIEEVYQLSDAYFFPVTEAGNCIDVPLSCLEAASCGIPVISSDYGEMCVLQCKTGFFRFSPEKTALFQLLEEIEGCDGAMIREAVLSYDWEQGAERLRECLE